MRFPGTAILKRWNKKDFYVKYNQDFAQSKKIYRPPSHLPYKENVKFYASPFPPSKKQFKMKASERHSETHLARWKKLFFIKKIKKGD